MPQSKFGGIPVEDNPNAGGSKFGGVPVDEEPVAASQTASPSIWDTVKSYLPSRRTALQAGGAIAGGALGVPAGGPFGAALGGGLGAGVGESIDQLIGRFRGEPETPQTSGEAARRIGSGMSLGAAQEGIGAAIPGIARSAAQGLYRNTLKPSTTLAADEATNLVNTGLRERIPVSEKGLGKLNRTVSGINQDIDTAIAGNPKATISPTAVARRIDPAVNDFQYKDLQGDSAAAEGEKQRFLAEHSTPVQYSPYPPPHTPSLSFPVQPQTYARETPILAPRAQAMKKAIWQELAPNDFGTVAEGYKQARKLEGSGLREELQSQFPSIQGLNAREGNLLELRPQLNRAVNRIANRNAVGIDAPLTAGAMDAVTGNAPLSIAAAAAKTLPGSRTAILLNRLAKPLAASKLILPYTADRLRAGGQ